VQIGFLELEERDAAEAIDAVRPDLVLGARDFYFDS
jgi:hypothetical protein